MILVLAVYVVNIQTSGGCQYGPRYMLPAMPFACLGLAGYSHLASGRERWIAGGAVVLAGLVSFGVNLLGATQGAMCCPDGRNAFRDHPGTLERGDVRSFPLASWLIVPLAVCVVLIVLAVVGRRTLPPAPHFTLA